MYRIEIRSHFGRAFAQLCRLLTLQISAQIIITQCVCFVCEFRLIKFPLFSSEPFEAASPLSGSLMPDWPLPSLLVSHADEQLACDEAALDNEQLAELGTLRKVSVQLDAEESVLYLIDPPPFVGVCFCLPTRTVRTVFLR